MLFICYIRHSIYLEKKEVNISAITLLIIIFLINMLGALYLLIKLLTLKKEQAPDREYKRMINHMSPYLWTSLIISVILFIIALIVGGF